MKLNEISKIYNVYDLIRAPKYKHYPPKIKEFIKNRLENKDLFDEETNFNSGSPKGFNWRNADELIINALDFSLIPNPIEKKILYSIDKKTRITIINLNTCQDFIDLEKFSYSIDLSKVTYGMAPKWLKNVIIAELSKTKNEYNDKTSMTAMPAAGGFVYSESIEGLSFWSNISNLEFSKAFKNKFGSYFYINKVSAVYHKNEDKVTYTYGIIDSNNEYEVIVEKFN